MYKIACTAACQDQAHRIASLLGDSEVFTVDSILSDPQSFGDFENLGLVFGKDGKGLPEEMVRFIKEFLGNNDLSGMQYMFSICVCDGKPEHALKLVEKLCAKIGCAPSLSATLASDGDATSLAEKIKSCDIELAKGSIGTMFYMKAHKIK